jgi:hypothetical protein
MTNTEAKHAMKNREVVTGGEGEDLDYGLICRIEDDMAIVDWESGVSTPCPIADLQFA